MFGTRRIDKTTVWSFEAMADTSKIMQLREATDTMKHGKTLSDSK